MSQSQEKHVKALLEGFDTVMLVTRAESGAIRARPMGIAEVSESGVIYLVTSAESEKVSEIRNDSQVTLVFQGRLNFVSLEGNARVFRDNDMIERLWSEGWRVWFPKGKTDPALRLLSVEPSNAEYWDSSGLEGISYAIEAAKAYFKGEKPAVGEDQHGKVQL
jgi:general stress protein 26